MRTSRVCALSSELDVPAMAWLPKFLPQLQRVAYAGGAADKQIPEKMPSFERKTTQTDFSKDAISGQLMGHFEERAGVLHAAIQLQIVFCFLALPNALSSAVHVVVVMILVQHGSDEGKIHYGKLLHFCCFDQPLIEPQPANPKIRNISISAFRKYKYVDGRMAAGFAARPAARRERRFPIRGKVQSFGNLEIDSLRDTEEFFERLRDLLHRAAEIAQEQNIRVDVAHPFRTGVQFSPAEEIIEQRCSVLVRSDLRLVAQAEFGGHLRSARFVPKQYDFRTRMQKRPALNGVALDNADVTLKPLRNGEDRKHLSPYRALEDVSMGRLASPPNPRRT